MGRFVCLENRSEVALLRQQHTHNMANWFDVCSQRENSVNMRRAIDISSDKYSVDIDGKDGV